MGLSFLALPLLAGCVLSGGHSQRPADEPAIGSGFDRFYNNDYAGAIKQFEAAVKAAPDDPESYNHLAQGILYETLFRTGTLGSHLVTDANEFLHRSKIPISPENKKRFAECIEKAQRLSQSRLDRNPRDIDALYALGVAHALRANYLFLIDKAWIEALREATAARKADEQVLEINPDFIDARLILGLNEYVVSSLPFYLRALGFLGGFHGDKEDGIRQLESVYECGVRNRYDAGILLAVIYRREHRPRQAIPLLRTLAQRFPENYLLRFEQVEMYSDAGDKANALKVLGEVDALREAGARGYAQIKPAKILYLRGNLQFWYGDLPEAEANLKNALARSDELEMGTKTLAWLRLGQVYDLEKRHPEAARAYREVLKLAPESDLASEAKGYLSNPYRRKKTSQETAA
jgi:tetratricopeptide (TPR) repeat protein